MFVEELLSRKFCGERFTIATISARLEIYPEGMMSPQKAIDKVGILDYLEYYLVLSIYHLPNDASRHFSHPAHDEPTSLENLSIISILKNRQLHRKYHHVLNILLHH